MINVFSAVNMLNAAGGSPGAWDANRLPAVAPVSATPVGAVADLLLVFVVTTLTGTSPTLQVIVEQLIAGAFVAVPGGTFTAVSAVGTSTYIVRGPIANPYRIRVVDGGTVTAASFTLSKWAGQLAA